MPVKLIVPTAAFAMSMSRLPPVVAETYFAADFEVVHISQTFYVVKMTYFQ